MAAGMQEALKKAGVQVKNNKRVWLWLKDQANPRSAKVIANALGMDILKVYPILNDLYHRDMVYKSGGALGKLTKVYAAKGTVYEVRPLVKLKTETVKSCVPPVSVITPLKTPLDKQMETWTVKEAHDVYLKLHAYFGAKS